MFNKNTKIRYARAKVTVGNGVISCQRRQRGTVTQWTPCYPYRRAYPDFGSVFTNNIPFIPILHAILNL